MTQHIRTFTLLLAGALLVACGGTPQDQAAPETDTPAGAAGSPAGQPAPAGAGGSGGQTSSTQSGSGAAAQPAPAPAPRWQDVTVPAGTALALELATAVSSETAKVETPVRARLRQALVVDGRTVLPAGAMVTGAVTDVERAGRVQGRSRLVMRFTEVERDGASEDLRTNPLAFEGEATKSEDATKVGVGAGAGAVIGGLLGGGKGAAQGAAIGGAAGAGVVLATRGREVELASGTNLSATLATPFVARVPLP